MLQCNLLGLGVFADVQRKINNVFVHIERNSFDGFVVIFLNHCDIFVTDCRVFGHFAKWQG